MPGLEVVVRRIGVERLELLRVVGRAVVVDPEAAGGELVEAQHVHDADGRQARAEQVRPLRHARADQQAAVAAALDRQLARAACTCSSISHSAAAMKSSKTFCFCSFVPAWCHSSPYSPPPRRFADRVDAAHLQPRQPADREARRQRDVEAAVAVEQRRVVAVELEALLVA